MHAWKKYATIFQVMVFAWINSPLVFAEPSKEGKDTASPKHSDLNSSNKDNKTEEYVKVEIVDAPTLDKESQEVLDALKKFLEGIEHGNFEELSSCLSENVTQINQQNGKLLYGKTEILENIKKNIIGTKNDHPVKRLAIYRPFISIKKDTAMVSFRATKELAGKPPSKLESLCSEVFEHKDGHWLVLQLRTNWKPVH